MINKSQTLIVVFLCSFCISIAQTNYLFPTEPNVRVRIINSLDTIKIHFTGDWLLKTPPLLEQQMSSGNGLQIIRNDSSMTIHDSSGIVLDGVRSLLLTSENDTSHLSISNVPYGVGWWWEGHEDRSYSGKFHVFVDDKRELNVVIHLPLEEYLKGVVPYEIGGDSPQEALKAQAVAARSEAIIALTSELYNGDHHDLTSDVECQVFSGNNKRTNASDQAVIDTRSLVISENQQVINAYYSSNCGGRSELIKNAWPERPRPESYQVSLPDNSKRSGPKLRWNWKAKKWIRSSPEVYCNPAFEESLPGWSKRNFRWKREFDAKEFSDMLGIDVNMGSYKKIKVLKRGFSGRIYKARLIFEKGKVEVTGELELRQLFKPSLRSANFYVQRKGDQITISGAGWGHGVGMCQTGAVAQAKRGIDFESILRHYYSRAELLSVYDYSNDKVDPSLPGFP